MATLTGSGVWKADWKLDVEAEPINPIVLSPVSPALFTGASSSFFSVPMAPMFARPSPTGTAIKDDLDKYLDMPVVANLDLDVLQRWKARDHSLAVDLASGRPEGLPILAKMARQFLGRPAASAGVERMFSKAGRMHDDMKMSQADDTLEHALLAAANTE